VRDLSLAEARRRRDKIKREMRLNGMDPLAAKREALIAKQLEAAHSKTFRQGPRSS